MDPQLLARLQQMMGGGAQPPPMGGGGMPAGLAGIMGGGGYAGPPSGGLPGGGMPFQPPTNARPMPMPAGGGFNMPMGAPSGGWPLGLAQQSGGRPPPAPPAPGGRPPGGERPRQPRPDGRPPAPTPKPAPKPAAPKPAATPVVNPFQLGSVAAMNKYLTDRGVTFGQYMTIAQQGGDALGQFFANLQQRDRDKAAKPDTPAPTPKPPKPTPDGRPPPNPGQQGAPSGFPGQLEGPNPIISPMFRHLFSNADVAKYGIKQPNYISNAYFNNKGLNWQTGVQKKWWEPNNPVVWNKD